MKKSLFLVTGSFVLFLALASFYKGPVQPPVQKPGLRTIIIDAGHGGDATGAKGAFSYEKDICLVNHDFLGSIYSLLDHNPQL